MTKPRHTFQKDELVLYVKKGPLILRLIIIVLFVLSIVMPTYGIYELFQDPKSVDLLFLFFMILFYLIPVFFLRLFLWNTWGSEVFSFEKDKLKYIADYRWFKDGEMEIQISNGLSSTMEFTQRESNESGTLLFKTDIEEIKSVVKLSKAEMEKITLQLLEQNLITAHHN